MKLINFYLPVFIFVVLISIPLLIPYFHSGYFPTHDGEWVVVRLSDMFRLLRDLQIPPRISGNLNFGYGYPLFNFAYPFPYYVGVLIHLLGFGFVDTTKILFGLTIPLSAFFMFLASRKIWGNTWAGIISSVLYLYFPYRIIDLFVRGSIGESFAFMIFPLILYSLASSFKKPESLFFKILGAVSYSVLITSHNIMAILFTITLFVFFIGNLNKKDYALIKNYIFVLFFGLVLSAYFWIPALLEKSNIWVSKVPIADRNLYFVNIKQLIFSSWGYGVPTDPISPFSYQLGWPFFMILICLIGVFVLRKIMKLKKIKEENLAIVLFGGVFAFSFLLFKESSFIWKLPFLSEINYPWIVLSQLGLIISLLSGYLVNFRFVRIFAFGVVLVALSFYIPLAKPLMYFDKGDNFYFTNDATTTSSNELMPIWVKDFPNERVKEKVEIIEGNASIENISHNSKKVNFLVKAQEESLIRLNTIYYPGWQVEANGTSQNINYENDKGVMDFNLPKGDFSIKASLRETPLRMVSNIISVVGLLFLMLLIFKSKWKF